MNLLRKKRVNVEKIKELKRKALKLANGQI